MGRAPDPRRVRGDELWTRVAEDDPRVEMHREVWHPSKVTLEAYRSLGAAQGHDPRLDLVAVAPDGGFGSYCICWFDPESGTGLFEPVGTRATYRGRGLGKHVMQEGLRRLRNLGARTASVVAIHDNEAARNLYGSVGFETVNTERLYGRKPRVRPEVIGGRE